MVLLTGTVSDFPAQSYEAPFFSKAYQRAKTELKSSYFRFVMVSSGLNEIVQIGTGIAAAKLTDEPLAYFGATTLYGMTLGAVVDYFCYSRLYKGTYETNGDMGKTFAKNKVISFLVGKLSGLPTTLAAGALTVGGMDPVIANQIIERPIAIAKYPLNKAIHDHQMRGTFDERQKIKSRNLETLLES